jgi:thiamine pyrophosphokinase
LSACQGSTSLTLTQIPFFNTLQQLRAEEGHGSAVSFLYIHQYSSKFMPAYSLLLCNGEPPSRAFARRLAVRAGLIVAADGGANVARRFGIRPDVIVGDLDSIKPDTMRLFSPIEQNSGLAMMSRRKFLDSSTRESGSQNDKYAEVVHVTRQDNTDLEKALDVLVERKTKRVIILAATGKRIDHMLGNLSVLWNYTNAMDITLAGDGWVAFPVGRMKRVQAKRGTTVSLIPFGICSGITLRGLQYPLTKATMHVGEIGLSNVVIASPFTVHVKKGNMLMVMQTDYSSYTILS